ncbi:3-deoxy-7-phosphoheptulonate synthase [Amycolatopsis sp. cg5]|uniref:3-deoxy-7-phosphoheptulonate synthase n=1 Tax=Amycolatopsis sp. cg5 TaxID=3238802 RepID=UPI0035237B61
MSESLLVFAAGTNVDGWLQHFDSTGTTANSVKLGDSIVVIAKGPGTEIPAPAGLPAPKHEVASKGDFRLGRRELRPEGTIVTIGDAKVGDGSVAVFAGPCAVENREQMMATASVAAQYGSVGLRGGAFKPRTSPYSFQGLRWAGLELLEEARAHTGLPILTECVDPRHVERLAETIDGFQIGARNMQNFELLSEVGKAGLPVVLKRGFGCTVDETLAASEYITAQGNDQVVLCERGIRTFEHSTRFTLDLSAVALMKQRSHLPVMVDPSHSVGIPALVEPMTLAAAAAGADALLIDIHVQPEQALCDGKQALVPEAFRGLMTKLELLAMGIGRKMGGVVRPAPDFA